MFVIKKTTIFGILLILIAMMPPKVEAALLASQLRYSNTADKIRIVVDLNEKMELRQTEGFGKRIEIELGVGDIGKEVKDIIFTGEPVRQAKLFQISKNQLLLDILLNEEMIYRAFVLSNPWRLVVDIEKEYVLTEQDEIAPGLVYTETRQSAKGRKLRTYYLIVDKNKWDIRPVLAKNEIFGRERLKNIVDNTAAVAAVNASYFGGDGWIIGNLKIDGEIFAIENMLRTALIVYHDNSMEISLLNYEGEVVLPSGISLPVKGMNRTVLAQDLVIYSSKFAKSTKLLENGCDIVIDKQGKILEVAPGGNTPLMEGKIVLSGQGLSGMHLSMLKKGDSLTLTQTMGEKGDKAKHVLGAGPRLLQGKRVVVAGNSENFLSDIINGRAPRTAIGLDGNGNVILFVVDGRSKESAGMTLTELAYELLALGAVDAMNLDGGGSSEMVVGNHIMNVPSDKQERRISVALGVFAR